MLESKHSKGCQFIGINMYNAVSPRNPLGMKLTRNILMQALDHENDSFPKHIPSKLNVSADFLSLG